MIDLEITERVNSSNSSTEVGNTNIPPKKQISPAKRWCFTLNNYTETELEYFRSIVPTYSICKFGIIGKEIGENGTPHLQGYIEFKQKKRPKSVFGNDRIHWEKAKGNRQQNIEYCSKENNVILYHPKKKEIKTIEEKNLYDWEKRLINYINEFSPDNPKQEREIVWIWSKDGRKGKTTMAKYLCVNYKFIILGGKAADCRNGVIEYAKAHNGETPERILINIPRSFSEDYVSYEAFENLKDMLFYSGKYEGGMVIGNCPILIIFSNFSPDKDKISRDRWKIINIDYRCDVEEEVSSSGED